MSIRISSDPACDDTIVAVIRDGLTAFNAAATGRPAERVPVIIIARDADDAIIGGCVGFHRWGVLQVDHLWVADAHRGQGVGTVLLRTAEQEARDTGCIVATLDSFDFQARPFYERLGYRVWGVLDGLPDGRVGYFIRKALR